MKYNLTICYVNGSTKNFTFWGKDQREANRWATLIIALQTDVLSTTLYCAGS